MPDPEVPAEPSIDRATLPFRAKTHHCSIAHSQEPGPLRRIFGGISAAAGGIAKILFFIFVVIFIIFLMLGIMAGEAIF